MSVVLPLPDQPAKPKVFMRGCDAIPHHLAAGEASTTASTRRTTGFAKRRLPYSAPSQPPIEHAPAQDPDVAPAAHAGLRDEAGRRGRRCEFTRMNGAEIAEVCLVPAQPSISSSGLRKMPPPTPVSPASKPSAAPIAIAQRERRLAHFAHLLAAARRCATAATPHRAARRRPAIL